MPIRINLMAEAQAAEEARRRDPVKRGIWIAGGLVAAMLILIGGKYLEVTQENRSVKKFSDDYAKIDKQFQSVTNSVNRIADINHKIAALDRLSTNRFLWGNVLNAFQYTMVDQVVVMRIDGVQSIQIVDAKFIGSGSSKKLVPGAAIEKVKLSIDARDFNPASGGYAKFKESLCNYDFFVKQLKRKDGFILDGTLGPLGADPQDPSKQFQNFTLSAQFPDMTREDR